MVSIKQTVNAGLCIGCGFCAAVCPTKAINMKWTKRCTWRPVLQDGRCSKCGLCIDTCPHSISKTVNYIEKAFQAGKKFGLPANAFYWLGYDPNLDNRMRSPSGGALTAFLKYLLLKKDINGVIAPTPIAAPVGKPHVRTGILTTPEDLDNARGSQYQPICYERALHQLIKTDGKYALVGVPCIVRGVSNLPSLLKEKVSITISLVCSHNVTGRFMDCLAQKEGIKSGMNYLGNLRKKNNNMPNANQFHTCFKQGEKEISRNRFENSFTDMWRNYFFAQTPCFYCSDFFGHDADLSVKDAWGPLSSEPRGFSLIVVRNQGLIDKLKTAADDGYLHIKESSESVFFSSQEKFTEFKHIQTKYRAQWNKYLRRKLIEKKMLTASFKNIFKKSSYEYLRLRTLQSVSNFFYNYTYNVPVKSVIIITNYSWPFYNPCQYSKRLIVKIINYGLKLLVKLCAFYKKNK